MKSIRIAFIVKVRVLVILRAANVMDSESQAFLIPYITRFHVLLVMELVSYPISAGGVTGREELRLLKLVKTAARPVILKRIAKHVMGRDNLNARHAKELEWYPAPSAMASSLLPVMNVVAPEKRIIKNS